MVFMILNYYCFEINGRFGSHAATHGLWRGRVEPLARTAGRPAREQDCSADIFQKEKCVYLSYLNTATPGAAVCCDPSARGSCPSGVTRTAVSWAGPATGAPCRVTLAGSWGLGSGHGHLCLPSPGVSAPPEVTQDDTWQSPFLSSHCGSALLDVSTCHRECQLTAAAQADTLWMLTLESAWQRSEALQWVTAQGRPRLQDIHLQMCVPRLQAGATLCHSVPGAGEALGR